MKVQSWFAAASNFLGGGEIFISGIIVRATWAPFRGGMQSGYMRMVEIRMMLIILIVTWKMSELSYTCELCIIPSTTQIFQLKRRRLHWLGYQGSRRKICKICKCLQHLDPKHYLRNIINTKLAPSVICHWGDDDDGYLRKSYEGCTPRHLSWRWQVFGLYAPLTHWVDNAAPLYCVTVFTSMW